MLGYCRMPYGLSSVLRGPFSLFRVFRGLFHILSLFRFIRGFHLPWKSDPNLRQVFVGVVGFVLLGFGEGVAAGLPSGMS